MGWSLRLSAKSVGSVCYECVVALGGKVRLRWTLLSSPLIWNGLALFVTAQCTGKRRDGRIEMGMGASQGGVL